MVMEKNKATIIRRETRLEKRQLRHLQAAQNVEESIGRLTPGCEIYGLTGGQFSMINIIEHCVAECGPSAVTVATWTAADADIRRAYDLLENDDITSLRFLVDASFYSRKPEWCQALIDRFGDGAIRATKSHCKFVTIKNERWNIAIRTSMNLNENKRTENFEISDDPALCGFMNQFVDEFFARPLDFGQSDTGGETGAYGLRRLAL